MKNNDVIEIVKSSNIPEEAMLYVLSAVAISHNQKMAFNREFREKILAAMPINEPIRIKEICEKNFPRFSVQKITAQMGYLVDCDAVKREEVETGRLIKVPREKGGYYAIEERIALFTHRF